MVFTCPACLIVPPVLEAVEALVGLALFICAAVSPLAAATPEVRLEVEGTEFHVFAENGALVPQGSPRRRFPATNGQKTR